MLKEAVDTSQTLLGSDRPEDWRRWRVPRAKAFRKLIPAIFLTPQRPNNEVQTVLSCVAESRR